MFVTKKKLIKSISKQNIPAQNLRSAHRAALCFRILSINSPNQKATSFFGDRPTGDEMNEWPNGWLAGRSVAGWMDRWTDGRMDGWLDDDWDLLLLLLPK